MTLTGERRQERWVNVIGQGEYRPGEDNTLRVPLAPYETVWAEG